MSPNKILIFSPYPITGASVRYRICQFLPELRDAGYDVTFHSFMGEYFFKIRRKFSPFYTACKIVLFLSASLSLLLRLTTLKSYSLCIIHRETFPLGPPFVEKILNALKIPYIFDFDDSLIAQHSSQVNQRFWTDPEKNEKIIRNAAHIITGNETLSSYACRFTDNSERVTILPTVVDTELYSRVKYRSSGPVTIGWVGNWGNALYLNRIITVFDRLAQYHDFKLKLVGGDDIFELDPVCRIERVKWTIEREIDNLMEFDIGIMPLDGGVFDEGKCGFKIIQYFALGIPAVASPIGCNKEIIENGRNGFLAKNDDEWYNALSQLLVDEAMRKQMGENGRRKVLKLYSRTVVAPQFVKVVDKAISCCKGTL